MTDLPSTFLQARLSALLHHLQADGALDRTWICDVVNDARDYVQQRLSEPVEPDAAMVASWLERTPKYLDNPLTGSERGLIRDVLTAITAMRQPEPATDNTLAEKLKQELDATYHLAADSRCGGLTYIDGLLKAIALARKALHQPEPLAEMTMDTAMGYMFSGVSTPMKAKEINLLREAYKRLRQHAEIRARNRPPLRPASSR